MERRGDKIVKYGEDAKFICFGYATEVVYFVNN